MDEIQKAKREAILHTMGFCFGLATLVIDVIPVIAIGAIIFCPYYAVKNFRKYRKLLRLQRLQFEKPRPAEPTITPQYFHL